MSTYLPPIVAETEWRAAHAALLEQEKAATRARDALAAARRRLPMVELSTAHAFDGPDGPADLLDLFAGRRQLIVYHFMFPAGGSPCDGCSMFADQVSHLAHLHARDTSFALVSPAPQAEIAPFRARTGWTLPWFSTVAGGFQAECGVADGSFALQVLLATATGRSSRTRRAGAGSRRWAASGPSST